MKSKLIIDINWILNIQNILSQDIPFPPLKDETLSFLKSTFSHFEIILFTELNCEIVKIWLCQNNIDKYISRIIKITTNEVYSQNEKAIEYCTPDFLQKLI
ncbi:MAG: hypothetical protein PHV37_05045 [Candidatus Gastranaerophilales bacterium]|nr:hypothetical protein [Candidatus Gastranaerophilales bacterium]